MGTDQAPINEEVLHQALQSMESALELLDLAGAPPQIGAHLDLAICALRKAISMGVALPTSGPPAPL